MRLKDFDILRTSTLKNNMGELSICKGKNDGKIVIHRYANRGKIQNWIENYEYIDKESTSFLLPLTSMRQ